MNSEVERLRVQSGAAALADAVLRGRVDRRTMFRMVAALGIGLPAFSAILREQAIARQATPQPGDAGQSPPIADARPETRTFSGVDVEDPYAWLENPDDPDVIAYLEAENAYREEVMAPLAGLRDELYEELRGRVQLTDISVPVQIGDWYYYTRTDEALQFPILARRFGNMEAEEQVLLDLNEMVTETGYITLAGYDPSPDHRYLAYGLNHTGGIEATLHVQDMERGEDLPEVLDLVGGAMWAADSQTLFYVLQDEALRPYEVMRHTIGDDVANDVSVFVEEDEVFWVYPYTSKDGEYLFIETSSYESTELHYLPADTPAGDWTIFEARRDGIRYFLEHLYDDFLVLTNEDAPNFQLLAAPVEDPSPEARRVLVPHRTSVLLEWMDPYAGYLVLWGRESGLPQIWVRENTAGGMQQLDFEEEVFDLFSGENRTFDTTRFVFGYGSLVTPDTMIELDLATGVRTVLRQQEVVGGHDPELYVSERLFARAEDGTEVPISLVRHRDVADTTGPLHLVGYGSYGESYPIYFQPNRLSSLDRGITYAIAHVRGGSEMGSDWYEDGKLLDKRNTFTDFIACAEHLVEEGYTTADQLIAQGASAGGLLMGAVANMRPDLFHAIIADVPFVDVLRTMLDPTLPLTVGEYVEWGNPAEPEYYDYIASYSPYDNVTAQAYPNMLITGGLMDDQVPYWQPAKWTAKLRATPTGDSLILLRMNLGAGHGGAAARDPYFEELAHDIAFLLWMAGREETEPMGVEGTPVATPVSASPREQAAMAMRRGRKARMAPGHQRLEAARAAHRLI